MTTRIAHPETFPTYYLSPPSPSPFTLPRNPLQKRSPAPSAAHRDWSSIALSLREDAQKRFHQCSCLSVRIPIHLYPVYRLVV